MKRWRLAEGLDDQAGQLVAHSGFAHSLARALVGRGVRSPTEVDQFLKPRLSALQDPFLLPGMDRAVDRIWAAIRAKETIVVYGDYDVDGVTSAALMVLILGRLGAQVSCCLPNRIEEGYGLSAEALERCIQSAHPRLIVTTDCGSGSADVIAMAHQAGIDVVVTDHHEVDRAPAGAVAVVNPKLGDNLSARMLAGVGVAFKVCHALLRVGRERRMAAAEAVDLRDYLDLVALGTIADVVPMLDENRILTRHGLSRLNITNRVGLRALADVAGVRGEMGSYHVGFVLGPRINAVGRMGNAEAALELLLTEEVSRARELASSLDTSNRERKRIETGMIDTAIARIDAYFDPAAHYGIVVGETGWHVGVVGIVASRLAAHYDRPAVVVGFDEAGVGRGSCRSIPGFDLVMGLKCCERHLDRFGGHAMAAGLEMSRDNFDRFCETFHQACKDSLEGRDLAPTLDLDAWVSLDEATDPQFMQTLNQMAPFGEGNPEPVWGLRGVRLIGAPRILKERHLKMMVGVGSRQCEAIGFGMGEREVPSGELDLAFVLRENNYMGRTSLQLQLQDFRPSQAV
ncbi:MAG: single-stranded-DNA-specific exonuclease RecJ [bacterium]